MLKLGSLCSGAGGLDMAVEAVFGAETVWHCELDAAASKVLAHRWPGVPNYRDLTAMGWTGVDPIDILCAGWPCQPFSLAGKQKGADDERAIWPEIARAIRVLRPRIVVLENVSAVLRSEFQRVADSLAALGYDLRWTCLRASDVGAPHRRERLFVVAYAAGERWATVDESRPHVVQDGSQSAHAGSHGRAVGLLPTPTTRDHKGRNQRDDETCLTGALLPTPSVADSSGGHASRSGDRGHELLLPGLARAQARGDLLPTPGASDGNGGKQRSQAALDEGDRQCDLPNIARLLPTPSASDGIGGGPNNPNNRLAQGHQVQLLDLGMANAEQWGKYAPAIARWEAVTRPAPSPTEPNKNGNPRLSAAFSEWLMGWPAGWVTDVPGISRNDQLRIIGNGVVPQCAAAALRYLLSLEVAA